MSQVATRSFEIAYVHEVNRKQMSGKWPILAQIFIVLTSFSPSKFAIKYADEMDRLGLSHHPLVIVHRSLVIVHWSLVIGRDLWRYCNSFPITLQFAKHNKEFHGIFKNTPCNMVLTRSSYQNKHLFTKSENLFPATDLLKFAVFHAKFYNGRL